MWNETSNMRYLIAFLYVVLFMGNIIAQTLPVVPATELGFDQSRLEQADALIEQAIAKKEIPGAVLLVARHNTIAYRKAYGFKQILPSKEAMEISTIFDLASLTKPIATATSVMMLIDQGKLRLLDKVKDFFPDFIPWQNDSTKRAEDIRLIHLLTHTSGLPPYAPVAKLKKQFGADQPDSLLHYIATVRRHAAPGKVFKYSCLNYITLQKILERVSGESLKEFSKKYIFEPLQMHSTQMQPTESMIDRCAPTEILKDEGLLKGRVHDPLARVMMGCISGNAGLFSTADDMALFSAMLLNQGQWKGVRILSPAALHILTTVPSGFEKFGRSLGWDLSSAYSSNQGDLFSKRTYGHTGYTGTSMVIDPETETVLILLTNRTHPYDKGSVVRLRSLVANVVAGAIVQ